MRLRIMSDRMEEPPHWRDWRPWFAWHPIYVDGFLVWLEWIERRQAGLYPATWANPHDYRLPINPRAALEQ